MITHFEKVMRLHGPGPAWKCGAWYRLSLRRCDAMQWRIESPRGQDWVRRINYGGRA